MLIEYVLLFIAIVSASKVPTTMPNKLKVLVCLQIISVFLNLLTGKWIATGIGLTLLIGVVKGHEGVRTILIGLNFLGLAAMAVATLFSLGALGTMTGIVLFLTALLGVAHTSFSIWCLRQPDVIDWMYQKSLPGELRDN